MAEVDQGFGAAGLAGTEVAIAGMVDPDDPRKVRDCERSLVQGMELRRWTESRARGRNLYLEYSPFIRRDGVIELRGKLLEEYPGRTIHARGEDGMLLSLPVPQPPATTT
jgi:hypothetical protein